MARKASIELAGLEPHQLATQIADHWQQWNQGRQVWLSRVREVIQYVYATSTKETTNAQNPWSHTTHVPKITQIHDNLGANYASALFAGRQFFTFDPGTQEEATAKKSKAIVNYLTTKHDYNGFKSVMKKCLDDWVQTGNAFARLEYVRETTMGPDGQEVVVYEGPRPVRISPYDICFDHTAMSFAASPKIIRSLMSRGELFRMVEEDSEGGEYDKAVLEDIRKFYNILNGWSDNDVNKYIQQSFDGFSGSSAFFRTGKVELLDFIGDIFDPIEGKLHKDCVMTVVDRRFLIRSKQLTDYQGMGRIYHCGWRKRTDNLWAQGPLDNLVGMQYLINHLENARADGFDQMLSPDRVHVGNVEIEHDGPITNYYIDDGNGSVTNLTPDGSVLQADTQIQMKEAQMEAFAGAPREALGIRSPGEKTAFEVQTLQNAAGRLFQKKIEDFEEEFVEPILNGELEISVLNLNTADVAKVMDDDFGVLEFVNITIEDLAAKGKLKARGASHFAKRAQLVQELQGFGTILAQDPAMAVHFPAKKRAELWIKALGLEDFGLYEPFGQIAEDLERAESQQAAQGTMDELMAAGVADSEAQVAQLDNLA